MNVYQLFQILPRIEKMSKTRWQNKGFPPHQTVSLDGTATAMAQFTKGKDPITGSGRHLEWTQA